jgi:hypothetical protein
VEENAVLVGKLVASRSLDREKQGSSSICFSVRIAEERHPTMKTRVFVSVTLLLLLFSLSIVFRPSIAHANPNVAVGSQVEVFVGATYRSVAVYGLNGSGTYVSRCFPAPTYDTVVITYGWYWQGSVYVYGYINTSCSGTASIYTAACVPYYRLSDNYQIDIFSSPSPCP